MGKWRVVFPILLGQLISFLMAISSFASSLIANHGVNAPVTQSFFANVLLSVFYASVFLYRRKKLLGSWYWYLVLAILDVVGSYLAICVAGLILVLLSDSGVSGGGGKKPFLGDVLVIAGTMFYASSNVGMVKEYFVKQKDLVEVVMMLSIFSVLVSSCEISIFQRKNLEYVEWSPTMISLFIGRAVATFMSFSIGAFLLQMSGATLFSLSVLTSNMWVVRIRIFFYHQQVDWLYYISFAAVAIGLVIYSLSGSSAATNTIVEGENQEVSILYEPLLEEKSEATSEAFNA